MNLFYQLIIGDSREELKKIESNSVHLVVTSPPYFGQTIYSTKESDILQGDLSRISNMKDFFKQIGIIWEDCWRIVKPGGYCVVNWRDMVVGSRIVGYPREFCLAGDYIGSIEKAGFYLISRWIWKKYETGAVSHKAKYLLYENIKVGDKRAFTNWEYIFAFKKRGDFRSYEIDFTREDWIKWCDGVWRIESIKEGDKLDEASEAAYYPVEIPYRIIRIYTQKGDVVLDPFLGSATTMLAAKNTQRSCIGVEIHKDLVPIIKKKVGWGEQSLFGELKWLE